MSAALIRASKRGIRGGIATLIAIVLAVLTEEPAWAGIIPLLLFADKLTRDLLSEK